MEPAPLPDVVPTERLLLRPWRIEDREPLAALNADPEVMRHFPSTLTRAESDALADKLEAHWQRHGWGVWALERAADRRFIGFAGASHVGFEARFTPAVELMWRLAREAWGQGYATEAARAALVRLREASLPVVAFTRSENRRSIAVMQRLGMVPDGMFEHPRLPEGHPLRTHVLYRAE